MNDKPSVNNLQLELHVPDFEKVKSCYRVLGFKVVRERKPETAKGYLVIERDGTSLRFLGVMMQYMTNLTLSVFLTTRLAAMV